MQQMSISKDLGKSLLWLSIIIQIKPQWAFAAIVPLLIGKHRFFFKLVGLAGLTYVGITALTVIVAGPAYGWKQYEDYFQLLANLLNRNYPWRTLDDGFLGYNHSITQIVVYLVGVSPTAFRLATALKLILLVPLGLVSVRFLSRPPDETPQDARVFLELAFAFYLASFIWLDAVWELSLGIAIYVFLVGTLTNSKANTFGKIAFLVYALIDVWQFTNFVMLGPLVVIPGPYVLTDPSIYLPIIMIVTLTFYALLVKNLGQRLNPLKW